MRADYVVFKEHNGYVAETFVTVFLYRGIEDELLSRLRSLDKRGVTYTYEVFINKYKDFVEGVLAGATSGYMEPRYFSKALDLKEFEKAVDIFESKADDPFYKGGIENYLR